MTTAESLARPSEHGIHQPCAQPGTSTGWRATGRREPFPFHARGAPDRTADTQEACRGTLPSPPPCNLADSYFPSWPDYSGLSVNHALQHAPKRLRTTIVSCTLTPNSWTSFWSRHAILS